MAIKDTFFTTSEIASIDFSLDFADVREFKADVLVLKYAQSNFGVDKIISYDLNQVGKLDLKTISPPIGDFALVKNVGTTNFENFLFIGVPFLDEFGYREIRELMKNAFNILSVNKPDISHVAMTIHGAGYGLDENEAAISQVTGVIEALQLGNFPKNLQKITIIENNHDRLTRVRKAIDQHLSKNKIVKRNHNEWTYSIRLSNLKFDGSNISIGAIAKSETKRHIFVAMPFNEHMSDTFYYGIQKPINDNDFLCERIDKDIFIGDILAKIKNKIESCSAVVADLTLSNPNVYLEVGYAWGIKKPTILLVKEDEKLKFDVQGQRCLIYRNIKNLEELLTKEIKGLVDRGEI